MPFDQAGFVPVGSNSSTAQGVYAYKSADTYAIVSAIGYFSSKKDLLDPLDVILAQLGDGYYVLEVGDDSQTVTDVYGPTVSLNNDAWGRPKAIIDDSIIHGMFTFNVPVTKWKESIDAVEQTVFANATSVNGKLNLTSSGVLNQKIKLDTYRNPRYEPNRGFLYANSAFLPSPNLQGERTFGVFTEEAGAMFRFRGDGTSHKIYAVRRTTIDSVTSDDEEEITLSGVDIEKGCTYDIQFQWRGVGNYYFYINQKLVHSMQVIGTLDDLSIFNPASPIAFECINQGDDVVIQCGCVDVTSEGGKDNGKTYGSQSISSQTGSVAISGYNVPILVMRNKNTIDGLINTRDVLALLATAYADQRCVFRVWATRDDTAITTNDQVYSDYGDGHLEYIMYNLNGDGSALVGTVMAFDTAKADLIFSTRVDQDQSYSTSALFEGRTDIYQTPGDIFIFTMHRETGGSTNVGATYEFAEAI